LIANASDHPVGHARIKSIADGFSNIPREEKGKNDYSRLVGL
jgi:hypothetical protein